MLKVLITGSSGLLGSHVVPLLKDSCELHLLQRNIPAEEDRIINYHQADLSGNIDASLPEQMDAIIYLAQSEHYRNFPNDAEEVFRVNTTQVLTLLDYGRRAGIRNFVFASTGGVYSPAEILKEDQPVLANGKNGFYASTKICTEILIQNYSHLFSTTILRFFFIYGKGQKRSMLIPRLVDHVRNKVPIGLQGEVGLKMNPIHSTDAAQAVRAALNLNGNHLVNVAGPEVYSLKDICETIGNEINETPVFEVDAKKSPVDFVADISLMKKLLIDPQVSFNRGVKDVL